MRKVSRFLLALTAVASMSFMAPPAHAMMCATNDEVIPPEAGDAACQVIITVLRPVCSKFHCG